MYFEGRNRISLLQKLFYESTLTAESLFLLPPKRKPTSAFTLSLSNFPEIHNSPAAMLIANMQSNRTLSVIEFIWKILIRIRTYNLYKKITKLCLYLNKLFDYTCVYLNFYAGRQLFSYLETMKQLNKNETQMNIVFVAPCKN